MSKDISGSTVVCIRTADEMIFYHATYLPNTDYRIGFRSPVMAAGTCRLELGKQAAIYLSLTLATYFSLVGRERPRWSKVT